ncbi:MAG: hypothetical protein GC161_04680 [Planctomycetaceae bacterium]|nr:hypothetical protein [Planctomycetaceae bacterium]
MKPILSRPATQEGLFVWVLHRFAEVFEEHAVLKGGIALALYDCPRMTTDIDYVFVPYESKKDVVKQLRAILAEIEDARVKVEVHSKMIRADLRVDKAAIQIEANVDLVCPSVAVPTSALALAQGQPSRLVRAMRLDHSLAHKIAAWNERRLLRDLFDIYFLVARLEVRPATDVLQTRLQHIESRLPALRRRQSMTVEELCGALESAASELTDTLLADELAPILPPTELASLIPRLRGAVARLIEWLHSQPRP